MVCNDGAGLGSCSLNGFGEAEVWIDNSFTAVGINVYLKLVVPLNDIIPFRLTGDFGKLRPFRDPEHDILLIGRACVQQESRSGQQPPGRMTSFLQIGYNLPLSNYRLSQELFKRGEFLILR